MHDDVIDQVTHYKNSLTGKDVDLAGWLHEEQRARVCQPRMFALELINTLVNGGEKGHATPWEATAGKFEFRESELTVWTGWKGHGKSLVLSQVIEKFISDGKKAFIISPEFPPHRILYRMMMQSVGYYNMNGKTAFEWLGAIDDSLWLYDQQSSLKPLEIPALCRYAVGEHGVDHIVIDSLMKCGIPPDDFSGQKKLVDSIQQVAHNSNAHIHLVAHSRKSGDDSKIGGLHDVKGSSEIADMAENVIVVWRNKPKEMGGGKKDEPDCIVKIEAQRNGDGWIGQIPLWFKKSNFTFHGDPT